VYHQIKLLHAYLYTGTARTAQNDGLKKRRNSSNFEKFCIHAIRMCH